MPFPTTPISTGNRATPMSRSPDSSAGSSLSMTPSSAAPTSPSEPRMLHERRPSLLSDALSKQESKIVHIGDPNGPTRLISFLSSSQGFIWNPEMFLPSFLDDYTAEHIESRPDPVHEIRLSAEDSKRLFPQ